MRRPIDRSVRVSGDTASHAEYGVGPATDYALPAGARWIAPFSGTAYPYYTTAGGYSLRLVGSGAEVHFQHGVPGSVSSGWVNEGDGVGTVGSSGAQWAGYHLHTYVIAGSRMSFEEYVAASGYRATSINNIASPTLTSTSGGGGTPIPPTPTEKDDDIMGYTYLSRSNGPGGKPQYALVHIALPGGYTLTQDINVANGYSQLAGAAGSFFVADDRWAPTLIAAGGVSDAYWSRMAKLPTGGGGGGEPVDATGIIAALEAVTNAIKDLPRAIDAYEKLPGN